MITAGVLLAAGLSTRFGASDKLLAEFKGRPLVAHAAAALRGAGARPLIAVVANPAVAALLEGFEIVPPAPGAAAQSASLVAGIARARALGADRALVALGDMPGVTPDHLRAVAGLCTAGRAAASTDGTRPMPPACFPAADFPALLALDGDAGARALLRALPQDALVPAAAGVLRDIDRPEDLAG